MNKAIKGVSTFSILLVLALIANLTWIQAFQKDELAHHPRNSRQFYDALKQERGQIYTGGQVLAQSSADEDGYYHRSYPQGSNVYGSLVGYLSDRFGAAGIEASQNSILAGTDDSLFVSQAWDTLTGKSPSGANVELTISPNVQQMAFQQLESRGYTGAVVAIKPSTGEILAMASTPNYNPSTIVEGSAESDEENFNALLNDPQSPLLNRATQQTQPPGSTFKVITTAAALAAGDSPQTVVTGENQVTLPGTTTTLENYGGASCGAAQVTLLEAFRKSCNTSFVDLSIRHGAQVLKDTATAFGVGENIGDLGLPVNPSTVGDIPDNAALGQSSIGQRDVAFTPLQNAIVAATIANKCVRMEPHIVKQITASDLSALRTVKPKQVARACDENVAEQLKGLMVAAEQYAGGSGVIASKTGTAEHGEDSRNSNPHAWYIAFSTTSDVAVSVLVENGGDRGQAATGGSVAAPIGRAVIQAAEQEQQ